MIDTTTPDVQQLVQEGKAATLAGDTFAARASFRRATELDSSCVEAWLGLGSVAPVLAEKREYLQHALALDPGNAEAQASLRYVEKLQAEGLRLAPSRPREERDTSTKTAHAQVVAEQASAAAPTYCYRHPGRETGLRCMQCNQPVCGSCSRTAPVGQLCPECRRARRPVNYKVSLRDMLTGGLAALSIGVSAAISIRLLGTSVGFYGFYLLFLISPAVAEFIVRVSDRITRAKRGRPMQLAVGVAIVLGALPIGLIEIAGLPRLLSHPQLGLLLRLVQVNPTVLVFMAIGVAVAVARLR